MLIIFLIKDNNPIMLFIRRFYIWHDVVHFFLYICIYVSYKRVLLWKSRHYVHKMTIVYSNASWRKPIKGGSMCYRNEMHFKVCSTSTLFDRSCVTCLNVFRQANLIIAGYSNGHNYITANTNDDVFVRTPSTMYCPSVILKMKTAPVLLAHWRRSCSSMCKVVL